MCNVASWIIGAKRSSQNLKKPSRNINVRLIAVIKFNIKAAHKD